MLFNFELRPLDEVTPVGKAPDLYLSWFWLTDGWYWIDLGSEELFKYTPEMVEHWSQAAPDPQPQSPLRPYVDYYVVRLWEDIIDMLPAVLEPIPAPLVALLTPQASWDTWFKRLHDKWEREDYDEETTYLYADAISWWSERRLSTSHLKGGCNIHFWTDGKELFIDWDNRGLEIEGKAAWAATWGRTSMPLQSFTDALTSFDKRLMDEMASRIEQIKANWLHRDISTDVDSLQKEQAQRAGWLAEAFKKAKERPPTPWGEVLERLHQVETRPLP
jgi:hypothetical protein